MISCTYIINVPYTGIPAYSGTTFYIDTNGKSQIIGMLLIYLCLLWLSGYSDIFPLSWGCLFKREDL